MSTRINALGADDAPLLWLDYADYAAKLLAQGTAPWLNTTDCVAWLRKAQGLLRSDVVTLPLHTIALAWVSARADVRQAMGARKKPGYPLKTLLGGEALRTHLTELTNGLRASFSNSILALSVPVPGAWLELAYRHAFGAETPVDIDDDAVDSAAVHIADLLRIFGQCGVDTLLLDASANTTVITQTTLELYQPIFNVCGHYRWRAGLLAPHGFEGSAPADLTFAVTRQRQGNVNPLEFLPEDFWGAEVGSAVSRGKRLFAHIPMDSAPETVLQRLVTLR